MNTRKIYTVNTIANFWWWQLFYRR